MTAVLPVRTRDDLQHRLALTLTPVDAVVVAMGLTARGDAALIRSARRDALLALADAEPDLTADMRQIEIEQAVAVLAADVPEPARTRRWDELAEAMQMLAELRVEGAHDRMTDPVPVGGTVEEAIDGEADYWEAQRDAALAGLLGVAR